MLLFVAVLFGCLIGVDVNHLRPQYLSPSKR